MKVSIKWIKFGMKQPINLSRNKQTKKKNKVVLAIIRINKRKKM